MGPLTSNLHQYIISVHLFLLSDPSLHVGEQRKRVCYFRPCLWEALRVNTYSKVQVLSSHITFPSHHHCCVLDSCVCDFSALSLGQIQSTCIVYELPAGLRLHARLSRYRRRETKQPWRLVWLQPLSTQHGCI